MTSTVASGAGDTPGGSSVADDQEDEAQLVEAARSGSQESFERLIARYQPALRLYLARLIEDDEHARDLAQEVMYRAWEKLAELREPAFFRAWLYRIATNHARSWMRRRRFTHPLSLERLSEPRSTTGSSRLEREPLSRLSERASGFEERVAEVEALERALARVPFIYRTCLLLFLSHGFTVAELAEQLDLSPAGVRTRLSRGMRLLRESYQRENQ